MADSVVTLTNGAAAAEAAPAIGMSGEDRKKANDFLVRYLNNTLLDSRSELTSLRRRLSFTYGVVVILSIAMFAVGMVLISVPFAAAREGNITDLQSVIAGGFGILDLAGLFFFRPLERIHSLMGDMTQITLALNSFQTQTGLRLLEMNADERPSMGRAAEHIGTAAKDSIVIVQDYFEVKHSPA